MSRLFNAREETYFHSGGLYGYPEYIIRTSPDTLNINEVRILNEILLSCPTACARGDRDREWPEKFRTLDLSNVPQKLQKFAANAYDHYGHTVLSIAAQHADKTLLQKLINMGAELNTVGGKADSRPPIFAAICNPWTASNPKSVEAVAGLQCLLDNGADLSICHKNMTPLEYARSRGYIAAADLIEKYMQQKASHELKS